MSEPDVHCPTLGKQTWMFDRLLADVVNQFARFPICRLYVGQVKSEVP